MAPHSSTLVGKSYGWRSLVGCRPWGRQESDTAEQLHFHLSLSCTREGNGNPLQCSCLENPRAGGAWWAAIYGVAQSRTRLKRLSSSSSSTPVLSCITVKTFSPKGTISETQNSFFPLLLLLRLLSLQLCPTLCDSPPGSPVPGILQARRLEWVAISFSNA